MPAVFPFQRVAQGHGKVGHSLIVGRSVRLRPVDVDRPVEHASWGGDPEIERYLAQADNSVVYANRHIRAFAIETLQGAVIGEVLLQDLRWNLGRAELRVCIGQVDSLGRGFGRDAIAALLGHIELHWHLKEIYLRVHRDNVRAVRCYEALGFVKSARIRAADGVVLLMSIRLPRKSHERVQSDAPVELGAQVLGV